jgi:ferredoxin-NADP reductase
VLARVVDRLARVPRLPGILTWPAPVDAYLRLVDPLADARGSRARVEAVLPETPRAATVVLRPPSGFPVHRPGQWVPVEVDVDGVRHRRCYSITSPPAAPDGLLRITVQAVPDGVVSNHLVRRTRVGDVVHLGDPQGDFTLPDTPDPAGGGPLLFITGGSGITPVMGMLRALAADVTVGDVVLVHHAPDMGEVLFRDELARLARTYPGLRVELVLTGPGPPGPDLALGPDRLDGLVADWRRRATWVCGPPALVAAAEGVWGAADRVGRLHVERFAAPPSVVSEGGGGVVHFAGSGRRTASDGRTPLLELAESAGLSPVSGCRMGVCRRCVVPLRRGTVIDLRDGRRETEPGTSVQICVSAAVGDAELDL